MAGVEILKGGQTQNMGGEEKALNVGHLLENAV